MNAKVIFVQANLLHDLFVHRNEPNHNFDSENVTLIKKRKQFAERKIYKVH